MNSSQKPTARKDNLVIQEASEELLVYDLNTEKAHCLNETAAFIWKSCDGENSVDDIIKNFEKHSGSKVNEDLVWLAIDQLSDKNLLKGEITSRFKGQSRREIIKKIGMATVVALPLVASLTAPTSVLAGTSCNCPVGSPPGTPCSIPGCPGSVCNPSGTCEAPITGTEPKGDNGFKTKQLN